METLRGFGANSPNNTTPSIEQAADPQMPVKAAAVGRACSNQICPKRFISRRKGLFSPFLVSKGGRTRPAGSNDIAQGPPIPSDGRSEPLSAACLAAGTGPSQSFGRLPLVKPSTNEDRHGRKGSTLLWRMCSGCHKKEPPKQKKKKKNQKKRHTNFRPSTTPAFLVLPFSGARPDSKRS